MFEKRGDALLRAQFFLRTVAVFITAVFSAGLFAGCSDQQVQPVAAQSVVSTQPVTDTLQLAWSKDQGVNPYLTQSSLTLQCSQLIFGRLVEIRDDFSISYSLASSVENTGTTVTIHPAQAQFADGTPIGAQDIAQSLEAARQSAVYAGRFTNVTGISVSGDTVVITLAEPDSLFVYLLDIPVLKASEVASQFPTASGRYQLVQSEDQDILQAVGDFAQKTAFPEIQLEDAGAYEAIVSGLANGTIDLYASQLESDLAGSNSCNTICYNQNNLVFLGVNSESGTLAQPELRQAVSAAISRREIADKAYYSRAYVATTVANSRYPFLTGEHIFKAEQDQAAVDSALTALGYTRSDLSGYYEDAAGNRLQLELLCYSGSSFKRYTAQLISEQLADCGIEITVVEEPDFDQYREKVATGQFTLYIGEIKLYNNMDLSPFFSAAGSASGGVTVSETLAQAYSAMRADSSAEAAFEQAFAAELPFIPLVYRNGVVLANLRLDGLSPTTSDIFFEFEQVSSTRSG